jgi:hypothetical protein
MAATAVTWSNKAMGKAKAFRKLPLSATKKESLKRLGISSFFFGLGFSAIFLPHTQEIAKG